MKFNFVYRHCAKQIINSSTNRTKGPLVGFNTHFMAEVELALIDKVELRIALAENGPKLQSSLDLYLCPLLLKLSSQHGAVRQQVLKFIQNIIPRINAVPSLKLPVKKLLDQAKKPNAPEGADTSTVQLYSLLFVSKGIDRLDATEKKALINDTLKDIHQFSGGVGARLFHVFTKLLKGWVSPDRGTDEFRQARKDLAVDPRDESFIIDKFEKLFLLVPAINNDGVIPRGYTCPGLSANDVSFLTYDAGVSYKAEDLSLVKQDVSAFIPLLTDEKIYVLLLIGAEDSNDKVGNASASLLRKIGTPHESSEVINHIVSLYVGDKSVPRSPVKPQVQERFLTVLNGSKVATAHESIPIVTSMGLNNTRHPRLKGATIQFIQWVAHNGGDHLGSEEYYVNVAAQLRSNLHSDGWPRFQVAHGSSYEPQIKQRRQQYEALGSILKKNPSLLKDLSYIEFLFDSLLGDIGEVRSTIQEALGGLVVHLPTLADEPKSVLKSLLKSYLENDDFDRNELDAIHAVRFTSLKYLNTAFPFNDSEVRLLNVFGTSTKNRSDVIEEAQKGLHPYWFNILQSSNTTEFKATGELLGVGSKVSFPKFDDLVSELSKAIDYAKGRDSAALRYSLPTAIKFVLQTLVTEAIEGKSTVIVPDQDWTVRLEKGLELDATVNKLTKDKLPQLERLSEYLDILLTEFTNHAKSPAIAHNANPIFGKVLLKLVSLSPQDIVGSLTKALPGLVSIADGSKVLADEHVRYAANLTGIIGSHPANSDDGILIFLGELLSFFENNDIKQVTSQGKVLSIGYLISRLILRGREAILSEDLVEKAYQVLVKGASSSDLRLSDASVTAIGEIAKYGGFGPVFASGKVDEIKKQVIDILKPKVKKLNESAILATALLSLSEEESISEDFAELETTVYETYNTKQVEVLFTSGEAFSILACGWESKFLKQTRDIQDDSLQARVHERKERSLFILNKVLSAAASSKPTLRKAGCIWLLSLVQYSSHLPFIRDNSSVIHVAFMKFLADKEELVQEAASRGLSLVYDLGDSDLKETLVKSLLRSFTDTTSNTKLTAGSISEDTELFEPGVLKTDDGSISTYKDILSLASEVGDPSLVYKFMSLAKSSALWSSRKGIAFGLGNIMSKSSLDKLLFENESLSNRLIPKLYRYRFDPNPSVARSMNDIWSTIIQDSSKTIETLYNQILKELLNSMGSKEWRVREASTIALTDLLQILSLDKYEAQMEDIWTMGFRAIDDIKESVRKAGSNLARSLSQALVNSMSVESGASETRANEVLTKLIPFLLGDKGILSDANDVKSFALETILTLVRKSGKAIKPFIAELIDQFVQLMSTLEPQIANYLALNAEKYKLKSSDIDARRLQGIGSSPMMNALEKLIDLIDDDTIADVIEKLQSTVKKSVGLPSKAAASRVIVTLVIRHLQLIKPYGDSLLAICISQLKDRNSTVSSSFATAAGYVCRVCSVDTVVKYGGRIQMYYFNSEDDKLRVVAAVASEAVSKHSGDKFASVASAFLPVAYIGKNDPVKDVAAPFNSEWSENTSGNGAVKLYIHEIVDLVKHNINSQHFFLRQVSAKSIAKACDAIEGDSISSNVFEGLFQVLIDACKGRSWSGKEDVLTALVSLASKSKKYIAENPELLSNLNKIVIVEAKRRNKEYQKHAIVSLGAFLNEYPNEELYDDVIEIFEGLLSEDYYESDDDDEDEAKKKDQQKTVNIIATKKNLTREADRMRALTSLTTTFQKYDGKYHTGLLSFILKSLLDTYTQAVYIPTWRSQIAIVDGLSKVAKVLKGVNVDEKVVKEFSTAYKEIIRNNTKNSDVENVKVQTVRAGKSLIEIDNETLTDVVKSELIEYKQREQSSVVQVEITNALN